MIKIIKKKVAQGYTLCCHNTNNIGIYKYFDNIWAGSIKANALAVARVIGVQFSAYPKRQF